MKRTLLSCLATMLVVLVFTTPIHIGAQAQATASDTLLTAILAALNANIGVQLVDDAGDPYALATESATTVVLLDSDETEDEVSDVAGCLVNLFVNNRDTTPVFVKVWLDDSANVTVGATVPNMVFGVASAAADSVGQFVMPPGVCIPYTNGLSVGTVTDEADSANSGPGANEVVITAFIKS